MGTQHSKVTFKDVQKLWPTSALSPQCPMVQNGVKLNDYTWVRQNADLVAIALESGRMPPAQFGGPWTATPEGRAKIAVFRRWMDNGMPKK